MGTISRKAIGAVVGLVTATAMAAKSFTMRFAARASWYVGGLGRTAINYVRDVGDGRGNSIVLACCLWLCRTFPEAPLRLQKKVGGLWEGADEHELLSLLRRPNPHYSGVLLWSATVMDYMFGNAYWIKVRSGAGRVVQLWWVPSTMMEPKWPDDGSEFISHYEYNPGGSTPQRIDPADVVHFRNGFDPANLRKGLSPLGSLLREVFTDDESASYTATLLRNAGMPGVIISPDMENAVVDTETAAGIKAEFSQKFGGDNRGAPMVMMGKTKIDVIGWNPQQMDLKALRRIPEERVTAVFGIPAIVAGLGAGLDRSTFANYAEAREAAYEGNVIPTQRLLAAELMTQLLPDFVGEAALDLWMIDFDLRQVRVLQEDENAKTARVMGQLAGGLLTLNEARSKLGDDALEGDRGDVFFIPMGASVVRAADMGAEKPEPVAPPPPVMVAPVPDEDEPTEDEELPAKVMSNGHSRERVAA